MGNHTDFATAFAATFLAALRATMLRYVFLRGKKKASQENDARREEKHVMRWELPLWNVCTGYQAVHGAGREGGKSHHTKAPRAVN